LPTLGEECEAFLIGRYAQLATACGQPVPPWGWANLLAHSDASELRRVAAEGVPFSVDVSDDRWARAVHRAARVVVAEADRVGAPIALIQDVVLTVIEAWLIDTPSTTPATPEHLFGLVMATLRGHPSASM